jgi:hypothetical protein
MDDFRIHRGDWKNSGMRIKASVIMGNRKPMREREKFISLKARSDRVVISWAIGLRPHSCEIIWRSAFIFSRIEFHTGSDTFLERRERSEVAIAWRCIDSMGDRGILTCQAHVARIVCLRADAEGRPGTVRGEDCAVNAGALWVVGSKFITCLREK